MLVECGSAAKRQGMAAARSWPDEAMNLVRPFRKCTYKYQRPKGKEHPESQVLYIFTGSNSLEQHTSKSNDADVGNRWRAASAVLGSKPGLHEDELLSQHTQILTFEALYLAYAQVEHP